MNNRRTTLIVAIVLAIGAGWLTLNYLSSLQRQTNANSAPRDVIVAAQDIPARVTITPQMLSHVQRPASAIDPNTLMDPHQAVGALTLITIPAGSSITGAMIGHPSDVGLPVRLKSGMRAVSVQIDKVKGVSGLIEPGDYVDVIADPPKSGTQPPPASAILRGVRVLAIGDSLENSSATPSPQEANSSTVTLEVTPKQADLLVMADNNTTLRLALRSPKEPLNSEPVEALHFSGPIGPLESTNPAPADSPMQAMAMALKAVAGPGKGAQNAGAGGAQADPPGDSPVKVIDGDHYSAGGSLHQ
ncbi:MAG TPA: Flp pilus assembly protein CpaB [Candidatus Baltobacteraceae bacterium]|nr:Flp pilus assembly protein CpaB [Candidatus Baltobacteraceae bacterium]